MVVFHALRRMLVCAMTGHFRSEVLRRSADSQGACSTSNNQA